jgi:hypothetical protein
MKQKNSSKSWTPLPTLTTNQPPQRNQSPSSQQHPNKSPGYELITGEILKKLPTTGIQYMTQPFNAVLLKGYCPAQWKAAQIFLILKARKPHDLASYRPISLLPIVSKIFENLLLSRLLPIIEKETG